MEAVIKGIVVKGSPYEIHKFLGLRYFNKKVYKIGRPRKVGRPRLNK